MGAQKKPAWFLAGAARSGTTTLYRVLAQYPLLGASPVKEPHYYSYGRDADGAWQNLACLENRPVRSERAYGRLFQDVDSDQFGGEGSTSYLWHERAPARLAEDFEESPKILVVLRDPVDRAFSSYQYMRRRGLEPRASFGAALREERSGRRHDWPHMWRHFACGQYAEQLERYFDYLGRENVGVFYYDDLSEDPRELVARMVGFITGTSVSPDNIRGAVGRSNVSGSARSRALHRLIVGDSVLKKVFQAVTPQRFRTYVGKLLHGVNLKSKCLEQRDREALEAAYREENRRLRGLLEARPPPWLEAL